MKHDANVSSNATGPILLHNAFIIILNVMFQENILLYLFRNTFDNSWVNVYWD